MAAWAGSAARFARLVRVGREVEEQRRVGVAEGELEAAVAEGDHGGDASLRRRIPSGTGPRGGGGEEALAVARPTRAEAGELGEGGQDVEGGDRGVVAAGGEAGGGEHQRHAGGGLAEAHLEPEAALAEHVAVVGEEDDGGVLGHAGAVEDGEDLADLLVDVADVGEIGAAGAADVLGGDREGVEVAGAHQALAVRVLRRRRGSAADLGVEGGAVGVEVPEARAGDVGVVRVGEADGQAPGARVVAAGEVVELGGGVVGDLVVVFELVGDLGGAGAGDRAEGVVPPVDALAGPGVVRGPAEVGGVDVGGQPLLEAVQLVGADEVHLAREAGLRSRRGAGGGRRSGCRRRTRRRCRRRGCGWAGGRT